MRISSRKWRIILLVLFLLSFGGTLYLLFGQSPTTIFSIAGAFNLSTIPLLLVSLALCIFSLMAFLTRNLLQGIIFSAIMIIFLLLRLFGITHWLFVVFLGLVAVLLEVLVIQG